jgi:hypothetical protein
MTTAELMMNAFRELRQPLPNWSYIRMACEVVFGMPTCGAHAQTSSQQPAAPQPGPGDKMADKFVIPTRRAKWDPNRKYSNAIELVRDYFSTDIPDGSTPSAQLVFMIEHQYRPDKPNADVFEAEVNIRPDELAKAVSLAEGIWKDLSMIKKEREAKKASRPKRGKKK